jgi:hypothetical protein
MSVQDASQEVRNLATEVLGERMGKITEADTKDVRSLLGMTAKPEMVLIGLKAVAGLGRKAEEAVADVILLLKHSDPQVQSVSQRTLLSLGPAAKSSLPELLKIFADTEGEQKQQMAVRLASIDAKNTKVVQAIGPVLVEALRPNNVEDKPNPAVLKSIEAIGPLAVGDILKALETADGKKGLINANHRKALFLALQRLGPKVYSEGLIQLLRQYQKREFFPEVKQAASDAIYAILPR